MIRESKSNYYHELFNNNLKNSKEIWSGINNLISSKSKNKNSNIALDINGNLTSDKKLIAESFNKYFTEIAEKSKETNPLQKSHIEITLTIHVFLLLYSNNTRRSKKYHKVPRHW